ncbi:hypothetical protein RRG08_017301 [Elysia crispata]|uniref:DNA repair protein RAD51 homolog 3 n=1 Tax=Elysia crispata TaxID=231223 RepID=A0AAE0YSA4_9GAST|nr:hypothetical protein RRG08_017301 [Elysia crispata]
MEYPCEISYGKAITTLPLNPTGLGKLLCAGLNTVPCFASLNQSILNLGTGISVKEAEQILKILCQDVKLSFHKFEQLSNIKSAMDLHLEEQKVEHIVTFCEALDSMLDGGIPLGEVTEFCGAPGTGKSQFCLQLAVNACIPKCIGGVEGETVYIDTEGSFIIDRLVDIARSAVAHCHQVSVTQGRHGQSQCDLTMEKILESIHCLYCNGYKELMAIILLLQKILSQNQKIKLVVVDNLASLFRQNLNDMNLRRLLLATLAKTLLKIAADFNVAVVLTNQMTTKIIPREGNSHLIPAIGDTWAHVQTNKVVLSVDCHGDRSALLYKASNKKETRLPFEINNDGIRDFIHSYTQVRQPP